MDPGHGAIKVTKTQNKEVSYNHPTKHRFKKKFLMIIPQNTAKKKFLTITPQKKKKVDCMYLLILLFLSFLEALPETEHAAFDSHKNNSQ